MRLLDAKNRLERGHTVLLYCPDFEREGLAGGLEPLLEIFGEGVIPSETGAAGGIVEIVTGGVVARDTFVSRVGLPVYRTSWRYGDRQSVVRTDVGDNEPMARCSNKVDEVILSEEGIHRFVCGAEGAAHIFVHLASWFVVLEDIVDTSEEDHESEGGQGVHHPRVLREILMKYYHRR